jgi:hypothetical protein
MQGQESVPSVLESDARGEIADIYADIRKVLGTSVVNLIWRNLATMPGALEWTWSTVRPLYLGDAPLHAEAVRQTIALPDWPGFSADTLLAAGVDETEQALVVGILCLKAFRHFHAFAPGLERDIDRPLLRSEPQCLGDRNPRRRGAARLGERG